MKSISFHVIIVICCLTFFSCKEKEDDGIDRSLAGSVFMSHYCLEAEATYGEKTMNNLQTDISYISIRKCTNNSITMRCITCWEGETSFRIIIPTMPLTGVPYDVSFDYSCTDAVVRMNDSDEVQAAATVTGWIRKTERIPGPLPKTTLKMHEYRCDFTIKTMVEGKKLTLHILSAKPHDYIPD